MLTVYKASAGSGKTYTLALRYISFLLGVKLTDAGSQVAPVYVLNSDKYAPGGRRRPNRHRGILAITFTNKATAEMKERIIMQLHRLASVPSGGASDTPYGPALVELFGCTRAELADAAETAVRELLCDYSQFNASTIDSFFQSVLRTFAREVNHQGDYNVEINDSDAVNSGIGMMLDEVNYGDHPKAAQMKRWIDTLVARRISEGARFNVFDADSAIRADLRHFVEKMCGEPFRRRSVEMEAYLKTDAIRRLGILVARELDSRIDAEFAALADVFSARMQAEGVTFEQLKNNFAGIIKKISGGVPLASADVGSSAGAGFAKWLEWDGDLALKPLFTEKYLPKAGKEVIYPSVDFVREGQRFAAGVRALYLKEKLLRAVLIACYNLEFLGFASGFIDVYRRENNLILLSDTNELLKRIINEEELPFIYERMGMSLTNLLIDEFQDTSRMQWDNLKPLVSNSLAENHDNLIIGDVKQAIYRFRNSDSSMLARDVEAVDFPDNHITRGNVPAENTNYRSAHTVVRFNNTLFSRMAAVTGVGGYEGVCQSLPAQTAAMPGYVRLDFYPEPSDGEPSPAFEALARDIIRQHESGYRWKDIAILVRARDTGVEIVNYLMAACPGIPIISDEALLLDRSSAVRLILSMLRIVDEAYSFTGSAPEEIENRRFASRREINMMISRFNFYLGNGHEPVEALGKAIGDSPDDAGLIHIDVDDVIDQRPANPVALVEVIVATKLGETMRRDEYVFIAAFQDVMESFFATHDGGLKAFLAWWEEHKAALALPSPPDVDAVAVMTIHKSKGLEWPCVHIPDCSWSMSRRDPEVWYDVAPLIGAFLPEAADLTPPMLLLKSGADFGLDGSPLASQYLDDIAGQTADSLNMTYVAFTRASNELIISGRASVDSKGNISCRGVGKDIADAFALAGDEPPASDGLTMPLALVRDAAGAPAGSVLHFEVGSPGRNIAADHEDNSGEGPDRCLYEVVLRDDTRELTSVEDALSEARIDIGGEVYSDSDDDDDAPEAAYSDARMRAAAERGTNIHNVLAFMRRLDDMPKAINTIGNMAHISAEGRREIKAVLDAAFEAGGRRVAAWFADDVTVLPEREIFDSESGRILRPDRVVIYPGGTRIDLIDYKFTSAPRAAHRRQVDEYRRLLAGMYPEAEIKACLWYPELRTIIDV